MIGEKHKIELQEPRYEVADVMPDEEYPGLPDYQSANAGDESILGIFDNEQQAMIALLLMCGLVVSIVIYFQTNDFIHKEGSAAMALILLLCQIRLVSEQTKKR